ncbi:MAG: hypothetical protein ACHQRL_07920 [Gemmatimonadales bacterium]|jgi:hypothetical protein
MRKLLTLLGVSALLVPGATALAQAGVYDASCQPKSGLPLRLDSDTGDGSSKMHGSELYTYGTSVRAPAGS